MSQSLGLEQDTSYQLVPGAVGIRVQKVWAIMIFRITITLLLYTIITSLPTMATQAGVYEATYFRFTDEYSILTSSITKLSDS